MPNILLNKSNFQKLYKKIETAVDSKNNVELNTIAKSIHIADLSDIINKLPEDKTLYVLEHLEQKLIPLLFVHLDIDSQSQLIEQMKSDELNKLFAQIPQNELVDIVYVMPSKIIKKIKSHLTGKTLEKIIKAEERNDDNIGNIIKSNFVTILEGHTLGAAIDTMKAKYESKEIESFAIIYVHDKNDKLIGFLKLREFLFGNHNSRVEDVMTKITTSLHPSDTFEKATLLIGKYKLPMMPVINSHGQQVGIVLSSDIAQNVQDKATRDIKKMSAVSTGHGAASEIEYGKASIFRIYRSRIVWIVILMIAATFTQVLMEGDMFEHDFLIMIAPVIPILMGTAGNAGGQASSTIIRSLSLGEITTKDYLKVAWKELRVSLVIGLTVFAVNVVRMGAIRFAQRDFNFEIIQDDIQIIWMSAAMFSIVVFAKFLGASMPILAKKIKLDPAIVAGPLIMTFIDLLSIVTMLFWYNLLGR